jgi:ssDNA-binding Zn-finger/Zn-ribbon topoisomerase 1
MKETLFKCPVCSGFMVSIPGSRMSDNDGVTIRCNNPDCPTAENVEGHSNNEKNAYEIACQKFGN